MNEWYSEFILCFEKIINFDLIMSCFDLYICICVYTIKLNYSEKHDRAKLEKKHKCIDAWEAAMRYAISVILFSTFFACQIQFDRKTENQFFSFISRYTGLAPASASIHTPYT